jgi:predicted secreted hydrolase
VIATRRLRAFGTVLHLAFAVGGAAAQDFTPVTPGRALEFPRDAGSHPGHRIEWWYVTGHLDSKRGPLGFQVTFFRLRNKDAESNPSRFSPRELLFAHAALADPAKSRLMQDQRSARALGDLVEAKTGDTHVRIDDWILERLPSPRPSPKGEGELRTAKGEGELRPSKGEGGNTYRARIDADGFSLDLEMMATQPVLLQGERGYSRKGPLAAQASYYYSEPQLRVRGRVKAAAEALDVEGVAWLDHEWSSELLAPDALGWDWLGVNLDGGGALMAFRIRGKDGATLWANATYRAAGAQPVVFGPEAVRFTALRTWKSPRTGTVYPVAMEIAVGGNTWRVAPLIDDQELDARASTGTLYWEGAVSVGGANGERGRGYLELTGYAERLRF